MFRMGKGGRQPEQASGLGAVPGDGSRGRVGPRCVEEDLIHPRHKAVGV